MRRLLAVAALLLAAAPALADLDASAKLGFDGRWIVDAATPLTVMLSNSGAQPIDVRITVSQGESLSPDTENVRVVRLAANATRDETFVVRGPPQWRMGVHVALDVDPAVPIHAGGQSGDRGTLSFDVASQNNLSGDEIPYATRVVGVVGDGAGRVASAVRRLLSPEENRAQQRACDRPDCISLSPELLRLAPLGLDGFDVVLACDPDARTLSDPAVVEGLLDWVALGGTLVVSLGEHSAEFAASPLAREMPATWSGAQKISYGELARAFGVRGGPDAYVGPWSEPTRAKDAWTAGDVNLARTQGFGRDFGVGRIVLLPCDLRTLLSAPWLKEPDARKLFEPVVDLPSKKPEPGQNWDWRRTDVTNAFTRTLQTDAFKPPPLPLVVLGIVLYVVVVGPLDWFVLKRLKKERLTTLTFLGAVLSFTVLAYGASLLLFSAGARVNRVVFADVVDGGREGRQLLRYMDVAGYYSPSGADRTLSFAAPTIVLPAGLPGSATMGGVGATMPVVCVGPDALRPSVLVQLAFRSQRIVRTESLATLGSSLEVEWDDSKPTKCARVVNGLPIDLDDVLLFVDEDRAIDVGPLKSGRTSAPSGTPLRRERRASVIDAFGRDDVTPEQARLLLEQLSVGRWNDDYKREPPGDDAAILRKSGIDLTRAFERGHGLLVARASKFPVALPGADAAGNAYVVLRKEILLP